MLTKLVLFEFKKTSLTNFISNFVFLLINMIIIPFTISPDPELLNQFFLSGLITSLLLGIVLITNQMFDEDKSDGSLDQYLVFGVPMYIIFLAKVIFSTCEFIFIITLIIPCAILFYAKSLNISLDIWLALFFSIPLLTSISIFGALLTSNLKKNSTLSILLVFPLLIGVLIILSLAINNILILKSFSAAIIYVEINLGLTLLLLPILSLLSNYLRPN
jgi:heme exporter protein B